MAVRADNQIAGRHKAEFRQQGMFHPAIAALVIMGDILVLCKTAADHHLVGGIDVFLRREVVHYKHDLVAVEDPVRAHALE